MKPLAATLVGLALSALAGAACAQGFGSQSKGTFDFGSGGTFGPGPRAAAPPSFGHVRPAPQPYAPAPSMFPKAPAPLGSPEPEVFRPYKPYRGYSIYSDRGPFDSYPAPPKRRSHFGF